MEQEGGKHATYSNELRRTSEISSEGEFDKACSFIVRCGSSTDPFGL